MASSQFQPDLHDCSDEVKTMIKNKKISRFYYEYHSSDIKDVWHLQHPAEGTFHLDREKIVEERKKSDIFSRIILLQYDVTDEEQQSKLYELYEKTKGKVNSPYSFQSTNDFMSWSIVRFKDFSGHWKYGYWRFSTSKEYWTYTPISPQLKSEFFQQQKELSLEVEIFFTQLDKNADSIKYNKYIMASAFIACIAGCATESPSTTLFGILTLLDQFISFYENSNMRKNLLQKEQEYVDSGAYRTWNLFNIPRLNLKTLKIPATLDAKQNHEPKPY